MRATSTHDDLPENVPIAGLVARFGLKNCPLCEQCDSDLDDFLSLSFSSTLKSKEDFERVVQLIEFHVGSKSLDQLPNFLIKHVKVSDSCNVSMTTWKLLKNSLGKAMRSNSSDSVSLAFLLRKVVGEI